jgi:HK97 family phage major capsid protein
VNTEVENRIRARLGMPSLTPLSRQVIDAAASVRSGERVAFPAMDEVQTRTLVDSSNSVASLHREDGIDTVLSPAKGGRIAPLFNVIPVSGDLAYVAVENARTEASAPTAYNTALAEGAITFTASQDRPRRVGSFIPATKGVLDAAGYVDEVLRQLLSDDMLRELDRSALLGDGTGENLPGVLGGGWSIGTQALSTDTRVVAIMKAATTIRSGDYGSLITVALNPADAQDLVLEKDTAGLSTLESARLAFELLGIQGFVLSTRVTAGTVLVGAWKEAVHLYIRNGVEIAVSGEHQDFFTKGLVAISAEMRATLRVVQPNAVVKITGF